MFNKIQNYICNNLKNRAVNRYKGISPLVWMFNMSMINTERKKITS